MFIRGFWLLGTGKKGKVFFIFKYLLKISKNVSVYGIHCMSILVLSALWAKCVFNTYTGGHGIFNQFVGSQKVKIVQLEGQSCLKNLSRPPIQHPFTTTNFLKGSQNSRRLMFDMLASLRQRNLPLAPNHS